MLGSLIGGRWGSRVIRLVVSLFLIWHVLAMIVAPAPDGYLKQTALKFLNPYLNLLFLQNDWGFFSPVGLSEQFRIVVTDGTGEQHTFVPTQQIKWYDASALWWKDWIRTVTTEPDKFADAAAAVFCETYAALDPKTVLIKKIDQEKEFFPADFLEGKTPFDPEFSNTLELRRFQCSGI